MKPIPAVLLTVALLAPADASAQSDTPSLESLIARIVGFHETGEIQWPMPAERELVAVECTFRRFAREAQEFGGSSQERIAAVEIELKRREAAAALRVSAWHPELTGERVFPGDPLVLRVEDLVEQTSDRVMVVLTYSFNVEPSLARPTTGWTQWKVSWSWREGEWVEESREPQRNGFRLEDGC